MSSLTVRRLLVLAAVAGAVAWDAAAGPGAAGVQYAFVDWLIVAALALSTAATGYGYYQQAQAADAAGDAAQAQADYDARVARNQAEQETLTRAAQASAERSAARRRRANIEAMYARSGVLLEGTPGEWLVHQAGQDQWNIESANWAANRGSLNLMAQADQLLAAGHNAQIAARYQRNAAIVGGVGSVSEGLFRVAKAWPE